MNLDKELHAIILLLLSVIAGYFIGHQRIRSGHSEVGSRTLSLVALGACLFTLIPTLSSIPGDPWRMAAGIIQGVGFLGAGILIKVDNGIKGVTTAAAIWVSASIGIAFGSGEILIASVVTVLVYVILSMKDRKNINETTA